MFDNVYSNEVIMRELGKRIKDIRISELLTQKQLAEKAGISARTMERIENGENVKVENIINIVRALDLIQNLDILIPEQDVLPTVLHDRGKKRVRATSKKRVSVEDNEWKWGDEE